MSHGHVTRTRRSARMTASARLPDYDAMVIGAGHNGLVCAAYLAKAGLRTLLVEARSSVGGTASSESFAGGTVNICNCDHITFRTTPVIEELGLAGPRAAATSTSTRRSATWRGTAGRSWTIYHDVEQTIDSLARHLPGRGRRLPAVREGRDAGGADGARQCQRSAVGHDDRQEGARPPRPRRGDAAALEPAQRGRRDARVLHRRSAARPGDGDRVRWCGVSRRSCPGTGSRCAHVRDAPRRSRRSTGRRQRDGARVASSGVRRRRWHPDAEHQGRPPHLRGRLDPRHGVHRRHRGDGADRRLGVQPARHVPGLAEEPAAAGQVAGRAVESRSPTTTATSRRSMPSPIRQPMSGRR